MPDPVEIAPETSTSTAEVSDEQHAADDAFELDLAHAGLLDSPLEGRETAPEKVESAPATATPDTPGATAPRVAGATPPAAATPDATTIPAATPEPSGEELAKLAVPFTYTVDGQGRSVEMIREIPGTGVVIEQPHVEQFRNYLQTADKAIRDNAPLRARAAEYARLGGPQKFAEVQARAEALDAMGTKLLEAIANPEMLAALLNDPRERMMLLREAQFIGKDRIAAQMQKFQTEMAQPDPAVQAQEQTGRDSQALETAFQSIDRAFREKGVELQPQDWQAARSHFGQFRSALFRTATAADSQRYGFPVGQRFLDIPAMHSWFLDRGNLRYQQAADVQNRAKADAENAKRLGTKPTVAPRSPGQRPGAGKKTATGGKEKTWSQIKNDWRVGRFATEPTD
jgi:hypothetical protein